ncbi:universal stress protein [Glutamicibacter protophormiae]|uniref:Nucleotide-binding universal stress UspA family protein n=1 Tax=Glutamicibacter protophormiae TaxID=37930 RepID=A0ABS4XP41_GLUPR|nr:universal stress protein [Glutamicibacter protophormiae]MBP2398135.1 nucleotide-binding universal stress UspA family protein [Glutamicibacter protophormiae]QRQ78873.1 universal stress protein [Glutamicibacter protophormiae]WPR64937.1 universal stress protein [Glutamicibacter protophormiae]WPR68433.1 universal stress protein [Glutamicibacter protophormiae]GGL99424.1 universal stress protein [Glutamicibacter protophormiae]
MSDEAPVAAEKIEGIVVGVDGSQQSKCALRWAEREAVRRGSVLNIVSAYTIPVFAASSMDAGYSTLDDDLIRGGAEDIVRQARKELENSEATIRTYIESGDPSGVLLDLSKDAELVVVGTRGRGGFVGRLLGSVSSALPAHAKCPTVVVPLAVAKELEGDAAAAAAAARKSIVVGVDGSDRARAAVLAAADAAMASDLTLRLICAVAPVGAALAWMPATVDQEAVLEDVRYQMSVGVAWLTSHYPNLKIETDVISGPPVEVLIRESEHAVLTVTGSRGRGGFAGMLLGSTSQGVLHHSKGPVMVVPDSDDPRLADRKNFDTRADD